ncbi:MAG: RHS repeat-associated core domain-containing protein, partial [Verrucomicrobiales bacterium]|nr:RHS repeat-associated core domain-containing protein [Verrucomicrobiales bacterium]
TEYAAGVADALSRPSALKQGATVLSTYKYLGLGTSIEVKYQAANNLLLTYENGGTGTAGDEYTGLDRFGRLVETIWKQGATVRVQSSYGRNRFGGVVWRRDDLAHAMSVTTEDNFYWYDGLYQVQQHQRGELNAYQTGITSPVQEEGWSYDEMGNWLAYDTQVPSLDQDRAYNKANEITSITNPSSVVQSNYDFAGNMTTMPKAGDWTTECLLKWDAWQRLVEITQGTDAPIRYTYDALTRRIITAGSEYRQYYYDDQWRAVEEQVGEEEPEVDCDYVWGVLGRWDLVRRRSGASLATSHFVLKDYLDPVAIADEEGEVLERFGYDAFGPVRFMGNNFDPTTGGESEYAWSFLFHAEFLDTDTGLYNYGYRYYHPQLGRWLSRDPIGERGGGSNLFIVVGNSPTEANDNLGLDSTPLPGQTSVEPIKTEWNEKELAKLDKSLEGGSGITLLSPTTDNTVGMVNQELLDKLQKEIDKENALKDSKGRSCYNIKILYNPATRNQFFDAVKCAHYVICTAHGDKNQNLTATGRETVEASGLHNTAKAHGHRVATIACHTTVDGNASPGTTSQLRIIGVATTWISTLKAKTDCPCPEIIRIIAGPQTQDYLFHYKTKDK